MGTSGYYSAYGYLHPPELCASYNFPLFSPVNKQQSKGRERGESQKIAKNSRKSHAVALDRFHSAQSDYDPQNNSSHGAPFKEAAFKKGKTMVLKSNKDQLGEDTNENSVAAFIGKGGPSSHIEMAIDTDPFTFKQQTAPSLQNNLQNPGIVRQLSRIVNQKDKTDLSLRDNSNQGDISVTLQTQEPVNPQQRDSLSPPPVVQKGGSSLQVTVKHKSHHNGRSSHQSGKRNHKDIKKVLNDPVDAEYPPFLKQNDSTDKETGKPLFTSMKNAQMRPGTGQNNSSYLMLGETLDPLMGFESSMGTQINSKFKNYNRNVSPLIPSKQKKAKVQASDQQLNFHDIRHGPQYQHPVVSDLDTINEEMKSHYSHATNIRENRGGLPTLSRKGETFVSQGLDDDIDNEDFDNEDKTFSDSGSNDGVSMNSNLHPKSHAGGAGQSKLQVDWASVTGSDRALSDNKKLAARILRSSTQSKKNKSGKKSNRGSNFNVDRANSSMNVKNIEQKICKSQFLNHAVFINKKKVTFPADQFLRIIHEVESYKIYYQPQSTVNNSCCCLLF